MSWGPLLQALKTRFQSLDESEIESILNQAMHRVWEKAATYNGDNDRVAYAWIHKVAYNLALDYISGNPEYSDYNTELETELHHHYDEPSLINWTAFIDSLTPREYEVLQYRYKGYKQCEIASKLKLAKPRITQIIDAIQDKFKKQNL